MECIRLGFSVVMYSNDDVTYEEEVRQVRSVVEAAHAVGVAVEGEAAALPGIAGELTQAPDDFRLTDPQAAREFIEATGVDAFAVNIGQAHLHGRHELRLRLDCLAELRKTISVPMVLHGATSVHRDDFPAVIALGIRKINVGSVLKQTYFEAVRRAVMQTGQDYNPYDVLGSGSPQDVLTAGRIAMQKTVEELMIVFGSAGKA
jgi:fructose/tagatose bisphosphate aldolase